MTELRYGLASVIPPSVRTGYGARWMWPDSCVRDLQDTQGPHKRDLLRWLEDGAFWRAVQAARHAAECGQIVKSQDRPVILHIDSEGVIVANTNGSVTDLYVAAWLHGGDPSKQPPAEFERL